MVKLHIPLKYQPGSSVHMFDDELEVALAEQRGQFLLKAPVGRVAQ
jgi:hypothetical protein